MKRNLAILVFLILAAVIVFQATTQEKSMDASEYVLMGNKMGMQGNIPEAIEAFKKALNINLNHIPAYLGLGTAYGNSGRYKEAIAVFKEGIQLNPGHESVPQMQINIASIADNMKDGETAVQYAKKALQTYTDQGDYAGVALTGQKLKQFDTIYSETKETEKEPDNR